MKATTTTNTPTNSKTILVVGATGGTGRATVEALLEAGYGVTAFSRSASRLEAELGEERLRAIDGDATRAEDVDQAVVGHDAVILTLGIAENPLRVRLRGPARTPIDVRSVGTRNVVAAMQRHGVKRLIVQSSFGVGETRGRLGVVDRLFFALLIKPQIDDTEVQEEVVRSSGLDWTLAQPVHLTDGSGDTAAFVSPRGATRRMRVSRASVAQALVQTLTKPEFTRSSLAISG